MREEYSKERVQYIYIIETIDAVLADFMHTGATNHSASSSYSSQDIRKMRDGVCKLFTRISPSYKFRCCDPGRQMFGTVYVNCSHWEGD